MFDRKMICTEHGKTAYLSDQAFTIEGNFVLTKTEIQAKRNSTRFDLVYSLLVVADLDLVQHLDKAVALFFGRNGSPEMHRFRIANRGRVIHSRATGAKANTDQ